MTELNPLYFRTQEDGLKFHSALTRCHHEALNQFLDVDIDKDVLRKIAQLRDFAEKTRALGDVRLMSHRDTEEDFAYRQNQFYLRANEADFNADNLAQEYNVATHPVIEKPEIEPVIDDAFQSIRHVLNQRGNETNLQKYYASMIFDAERKELKLHSAMDKEKRRAPAEIKLYYERVKQAYRAGLIIAKNPEPMEYEHAMQLAGEQLKESKGNKR